MLPIYLASRRLFLIDLIEIDWSRGLMVLKKVNLNSRLGQWWVLRPWGEAHIVSDPIDRRKNHGITVLSRVFNHMKDQYYTWLIQQLRHEFYFLLGNCGIIDVTKDSTTA